MPGSKEPGTRALIAAQYSQNSPKNNGPNGILSGHFGVKVDAPKGRIGPIQQCYRAMTGSIDRSRRVRLVRIDPAQNFVEMSFDGVVAKT